VIATRSERRRKAAIARFFQRSSASTIASGSKDPGYATRSESELNRRGSATGDHGRLNQQAFTS
jgi:hypothetical protein